MSDHCECQCGKEMCASAPGRRPNRAGVTIHGSADAYNRGCRCKECTAASVRKSAARFQRRNGETRKQATRLYKPWTAEDLAVAARADLTDYEAGLLLGRTMRAVRSARERYGIGAKS